MQLLVVHQGRTGDGRRRTDQRRSDSRKKQPGEEGGKEGIAGSAAAAAALKSASLVRPSERRRRRVSFSLLTSFSLAVSTAIAARGAVALGDRRGARSKQAGTGFDVDRAPAAAAAAAGCPPLSSPGSVYFIAFTVPHSLSLFYRVDHRGPRNLERNSSNAAASTYLSYAASSYGHAFAAPRSLRVPQPPPREHLM